MWMMSYTEKIELIQSFFNYMMSFLSTGWAFVWGPSYTLGEAMEILIFDDCMYFTLAGIQMHSDGLLQVIALIYYIFVIINTWSPSDGALHEFALKIKAIEGELKVLEILQVWLEKQA